MKALVIEEPVTASYLVHPITSASTVFEIAPAGHWREHDGSPPAAPFVVIIDPFTASTEEILCSSLDPDTGRLTVLARAYNNSMAVAHLPRPGVGPTVFYGGRPLRV